MNIFALALAYLRANPANTLLNALMMGLGVGTVTLAMLVTGQLNNRMARDSRGIDLIVGAKGSPMQLVLSGVYHLDTPTGNVPLAEIESIRSNPMVKRLIPLVLGDHFRSHRIVGTTLNYVEQQGASILRGRLWKAPFEAVLGADVARRLQIDFGATIVGTHGLAGGGAEEEGAGHRGTPYMVVGVLAPTGTAIDGLVLTSVESVWLQHVGFTANSTATETLAELRDEDKALTFALIQYATPNVAATLPRAINTSAVLQAASPTLERARLFRILGVGVDVIRAFAIILMLASALSILIALYNALEERRFDLAVMRMLGASRIRLLMQVLLEGLLVAALGAAIGLALGHIATEALGVVLRAQNQPTVTGYAFVREELWLVGLALAAGLLAALVPAWRAYRRDVAVTLAQVA